MKKDDPYRKLALKLLFRLPRDKINSIQEGDTKIITQMLQAEIRDLDWNGMIIDTLWADLSSIQDARWIKMQTEGLGKTLAARFDFERLRSYLTSLTSKL